MSMREGGEDFGQGEGDAGGIMGMWQVTIGLVAGATMGSLEHTERSRNGMEETDPRRARKHVADGALPL